MCDQFIHPGLVEDSRLSRRTFGVMTIAVAAIASTARAQVNVVEKDVEVKTADGTCDAVLFYPEGPGTKPPVLIWTDIAGLRPAFRDMGRRLAGQGMWCWYRTPSTVPRMLPSLGQHSISAMRNSAAGCSLTVLR